jgi:hypothetical protein
MARELGGHLEVPRFSWKYSWIEAILGRRLARRAQVYLPRLKWSLVRSWDKALFHMENQRVAGTLGTQRRRPSRSSSFLQPDEKT